MAQEKIFYYTEEIEKQLVADSEYYEVNKNVLNDCGSIVEGTLPNIFYVPNLMLSYLLSNNKYKAYNRLTEEYEIFDNSLIIDAFSIGFKEGRKGFKDQFDFPESMLDEKKANRNFKRLEAFIQNDELLKDNKICNLKPRTLLSSEFLNLGIASGKYFEILLLKEKYSVEFEEYSKWNESIDKSKLETREEKVSKALIELGYYNLDFVSLLNDESKEKLLSKLTKVNPREAVPYLDKIGFFKYTDIQFGTTKGNSKIQKAYKDSKDNYGTQVRKYRKSLIMKPKRSSEDCTMHIEEAEKFLSDLK